MKRGDEQQVDGEVPTCLYQPELEHRDHLVVLTLAMQIKRLDGKRMLLSPDGHDLFMPAKPEPRPHLVTPIGQAHHWYDLLMRTGISMSDLAQQTGMSESRPHKLLPLTRLAPDIVRRVLIGDLPPSLTLDDLLAAAKHLDWRTPRRDLNLHATKQTG